MRNTHKHRDERGHRRKRKREEEAENETQNEKQKIVNTLEYNDMICVFESVTNSHPWCNIFVKHSLRTQINSR